MLLPAATAAFHIAPSLRELLHPPKREAWTPNMNLRLAAEARTLREVAQAPIVDA